LTAFAAQEVDAVLLFAQAAHYLHSSDGFYVHNGAALYAAIQSMAAPRGLSSPSIFLDSSGDRLGTLAILNLQPSPSSTQAQLIGLQPSVAQFVRVAGSFDTASRALEWTGAMRFASGPIAPSDGSGCTGISLSYNVSATCDACRDRTTCERIVSFAYVGVDFAQCPSPSNLNVPCDYVAEASSVAVAFRVICIILCVLVVAVTGAVWTAHESRIHLHTLTQRLLLSIAALFMATSAIYFAGSNTNDTCVARPLLSVHASFLITIGLHLKAESPNPRHRKAACVLLLLGIGCYVASMTTLAVRPLGLRAYPVSYEAAVRNHIT
jgi:hypothetical protein